jgi:hypothetical protein
MQNINACLYVRPDGNTAQKIAMRARIVLASGRGLGTNAIMREARTSKPSVWRWQTRYMEAGIKGLFKDKGKASEPARNQSVRSSGSRTGKAGQCHALECAHDGRGDERHAHHRAAHPEGERAQAASHTHI